MNLAPFCLKWHHFEKYFDRYDRKKNNKWVTPKWHQKWCQQKVLFDEGFRLKNSSDTVLGGRKV